jgi:ubiquinone/menaquinone biosynthesis C-methylase UbiE
MQKANAVMSLFTRAIRKPRIRKWVWRNVYEFLPLFLDSNLDFMNYGYVPLNASEDNLKLNPEDEPHRYAIWLYWQLLQAVEVRDRRVLEVGCGRGGGSAFIRNYLSPLEVVGADYSKRAVALCNRRHHALGLTFVHSDAEALAFSDEQFDLVVNVESSHCYGSMDSFFSEVVRVLCPAGYFLFADFREASEIETIFGLMEQSGMLIVSRSDITSNVLEALCRDSERRRNLIRSGAPHVLWDSMEQFAGVENSIMYENFRSGQFRYVSSVIQKISVVV